MLGARSDRFGGQRQTPEVSESHALVDSVPSDGSRGHYGLSAWALDGRCRLAPAAIDFPLIGLFPAPENPDKLENRKATDCVALQRQRHRMPDTAGLKDRAWNASAGRGLRDAPFV